MKIRQGFVSNSSSSSFVICKEFLTEKQEDAIRKWYTQDRDMDVYPGDNGDYFEETEYYMSAEVRNIYNEFEELCKKHKIDMGKIFWNEG